MTKKLNSCVVDHYTCSNCNTTYYSKTCRHFFTRAAEQIGIYNSREKHVKNVKESATFNHPFQCGCLINLNHFDNLDSHNNKIRLPTMESMLIKHDKPVLN